MDQTTTYLLFATGAVLLGILVTWLILRTKIVSLKQVRDRLEGDLQEAEGSLSTIREERDKVKLEATRLAAEVKAEQDKQQLLETAEKELREAFKALSANALEESSKSFVRLAKATFAKEQEEAGAELEKRKTAIEGLVKPISESLKEVRTYVEAAEKARTGAYQTLTDQVKNLNDETRRLSGALRQPTVRGRWGEVQLRRVVELAGMSDQCDFTEQETIDDGEVKQRPDLIVRLPGDRIVVVDAKAPLQHYLDAIESQDPKEQEILFDRFAAGVKNHVRMLSGKSYQSGLDSTPDFVVLFLPGEVFFGAALQRDSGLVEFASDHNVVLAAPTTLIALLRAVAYGWQQQRVSENARKIMESGRELYDRICTFGEHLSRHRRSLDSAVDSYNKAVGSLERAVLPSARRMKELELPTSKELDQLEPIDHAARRMQAAELTGGEEGDEVD